MHTKQFILPVLLLLAACASAQMPADTTLPHRIYNYVEQMPSTSFNFKQYIGDNVHYPDSARYHNIEGRVIIKFVVNEDGHVSDCTVAHSVDSYCDAEALRVVKNMPPWKPGLQNGVPVKVYFTLPIVFKLTD